MESSINMYVKMSMVKKQCQLFSMENKSERRKARQWKISRMYVHFASIMTFLDDFLYGTNDVLSELCLLEHY